jgi:hypothetical protein
MSGSVSLKHLTHEIAKTPNNTMVSESRRRHVSHRLQCCELVVFIGLEHGFYTTLRSFCFFRW